MKKTLSILLICFSLQVAKAQSVNTPISMIRQFYTSYITSVANDQPGDSEVKLHALEKKYCTQKLIDRLPEIVSATDADPFLKAQDSDTKVLKTLVVKKSAAHPNEYNVSYSFKDLDSDTATKINIFLTLVRLKGGYRIDGVR